MTKQELMENFTMEQLADMVVDLQKENLVEILKLKNREDTENVQKVFDAMRLTITELCNTVEDLKKECAKMLWEYCDCVNKEEHEKLKEKISSYEVKIDKLEKELKQKDGTKMFETLMENTDGEAADLLAQHMYENLKCIRTNTRMADDVSIIDFLPAEPNMNTMRLQKCFAE